MIIKPNPSLPVPIYLQVVEQVKHAIETGALRPGDQLPGRQLPGKCDLADSRRQAPVAPEPDRLDAASGVERGDLAPVGH